MKNIFITASILGLVIINGSAFAGDLSKGELRAQFAMKVATCKATAKADGVKTASSDFYGYMGTCLDRITVAVNVAPATAK